MKLPKVSFLQVLKHSKDILTNPLPFHRQKFAKHGDTFQIGLGFGKSAVFTRDAGFAKHILQTNQKKYKKSPMQSDDLGYYIGNGLLTANGAYWLKQRRLIQPGFYKKQLESVAQIIVSEIKNELSRIKVDETVDIYPLIHDLAFKVVAKSLFSYSGSDEQMQRLQEITEQIQIDVIKEVRQPYKKWWFKVSGQIKKTETLAKEVKGILEELILERKQSSVPKKDLLNMLLNSTYGDGTKMQMQQLVDEILILIVAGYETTSNALSFTLMLLSKHPEIQEQIYEEVKGVEPQKTPMIDFFNKVLFTNQCIQESMRLYPPAYFSDRITTEDDMYKGTLFPKGTMILLSFYEIHRHASFWDNPLDYNPGRFNPKNKKNISDSYFPFGAGPRMCVGNHFAMYEMLVVISEVVKKYKIYPKFKNIEVNPLITLNPVNALLSFQER